MSVDADVTFAADGLLDAAWNSAMTAVERCIVSVAGQAPILHEGGIYNGTWLESTASICCEVLARFRPGVATETIRRIAAQPRTDGMLPYKVTPEGPAYRQIQMVTPFARSVRRVAALASDGLLIADTYPTLAVHDAWLARHRDTRNTGGVEAFCTYDTGHDRSPRFWHIPDSCPDDDPTRFDVDNPRLPFVAPDLTANVACQRRHLGDMAEELGHDAAAWRTAAAATERALWRQCWHPDDGTFYDLDATDTPVRVNTDALLRVLSCGIGDDDFFDAACRRHLLNTRRFFAAYPFSSVALDDPRFDPHTGYNSWGGATNMLALLRAPDAFEAHGRFTELSWALWPTVAALSREDRWAQTISPWVGDQGFTSDYAPAALALLDFVERTCGILPRPDGTVWVTGCRAPQVQHDLVATSTHHTRRIEASTHELHIEGHTATLVRDGVELARWPVGLRLVLEPSGELREVVGMVARTVMGRLHWGGTVHQVGIAGNERWRHEGDALVRVSSRGVIAPR